MTTPGKPKIWTPRRQRSGTWFPGIAMAMYMSVVVGLAYRQGVSQTVMVLAACFPLIWWFATALLSQLANTPMRNELARVFARSHGAIDSPWSFVGVSTPTYKSPWDLHEDVGLLIRKPDELEFVGDSLAIQLKRSEIGRVVRKRHALSWFGLGSWIEIWSVDASGGCLLRIESRQESTRLGNAWASDQLAESLLEWHQPKN